MRFSTFCLVLGGAILALSARAELPVPVPLTENEREDTNPAIHDGRVVWQGEDDTGITQIYLWDGETTVPLTDGEFDQGNPAIHGERIVWDGWDGEDQEVYLFDGETTTQLTDNACEGTPSCTAFDGLPAVSDTWVAWSIETGAVDPGIQPRSICFTDGESMGCDNLYHLTVPPGLSGSRYAVCAWNDFPPVVIVVDLSDVLPWWFASGVGPPSSSSLCRDADVDGDVAVWSGNRPLETVRQIFWNDGSGVAPLTDTEGDNRNPRISLPYVVWEHFDGADWEIHAYDGVSVFPVTDNDWDDRNPDVAGGQVVWESYEGGDAEIVLATLPAPEPGAALTASAALAALAATARGRARRYGASGTR